MSNHKTDNSSLRTKVAFRLNRLPTKEKITVLDCYHGSGACWRNINLHSVSKIQIHGLDIDDKDSFVLLGDNRKVLPGLNLSRYDVIDVDSYGVPYDVLSEIFAYDGDINATIFYTFCQTHMRQMPKGMLLELGYTDVMYQKSPTLVSKGGHDKFLHWLANNGVTHVEYIKLPGSRTRVYGCFRIGKLQKAYLSESVS